MPGMYRPGRRLYVDKTRSKIVPEGSPEAAFLLVSASGELPVDEAKRLGLLDASGAVVSDSPPPSSDTTAPEPELEDDEVEAKMVDEPPEDKAVPAPQATKAPAAKPVRRLTPRGSR